MPAHTTRIDDLPSRADLRAKAEAHSAGKLLNELPAGALVRTDDGEGDTPDNEEIRLKLAGALAAKMEGVDAETATRMASAGNALLAPLQVRADDAKADDVKADAIVNSPTTSHAADDKAAGDTAPTLTAIMDTLGKITGRLDALEGRKDGEHTVTPPNDKKAADDSVTDDAFKWRMKQDRLGTVVCSPDTQDAFALVQSRADKVSFTVDLKALQPDGSGRVVGRDNKKREFYVTFDPGTGVHPFHDLSL